MHFFVTVNLAIRIDGYNSKAKQGDNVTIPKGAKSPCDLAAFALRFGFFCKAIWLLLESGMTVIGMQIEILGNLKVMLLKCESYVIGAQKASY